MLLEAEPLLGEASQTDAVPEPVETHHPDVVILDLANQPGISRFVLIPQLTGPRPRRRC